jgi:hypothetical protein
MLFVLRASERIARRASYLATGMAAGATAPPRGRRPVVRSKKADRVSPRRIARPEVAQAEPTRDA